MYYKSYQDSFAVSFHQDISESFFQSVKKVALFITPEYEGIFRNGGVGTYYSTLSQKFAAEGWYNILILCRNQDEFNGKSNIQSLNHIFSTVETKKVLNIQDIHLNILNKIKNYDWLEYDNFCALFFTQAVANIFNKAVVYIDFPEMYGLGYRTIQAKQTGVLGNNCVIAVTLHSGQEWLREANKRYIIDYRKWFQQACHYEQYSFEHADLAFFPSHYLKAKVESYGWKTSHALHLPYCFPILKELLEKSESCSFQIHILSSTNITKIPLVFFGRLEERKGLRTFVEAVKLLELSLKEKIHIFFLGKIVSLHSPELKSLNSQQYIEREIGDEFSFSIINNLFSQEAIQLVSKLRHPIVCLTSSQDNFPNSALEMGQLPVSLVVSDTEGFREALNLVHRSLYIHWFQSENAISLSYTINHATSIYPEKSIQLVDRNCLNKVNQRLLNQRLKSIELNLSKAAIKKTKSSKITIGIICFYPNEKLWDCLESLSTQTYKNIDVVVLYKNIDNSTSILIKKLHSEYSSYKFVELNINTSLGSAYNHLVEYATGEYCLHLLADHIALPFMAEAFVDAGCKSGATAVVCSQMTLGNDHNNSKQINGSLARMLDFNQNNDIYPLFSTRALKEFRYLETDEVTALNWQIIAAMVATGKLVVYHPYPLYVLREKCEFRISSTSLYRERYYLRHYLCQIEPSKWSQRQLNLLLTSLEQSIQFEAKLQD